MYMTPIAECTKGEKNDELDYAKMKTSALQKTVLGK